MFAVTSPGSWEETRRLCRRLSHGWIFRGHADADWPLATTLERKAAQYNCSPENIRGRELWILRNFYRRARLYLSNPPAKGRSLEWLALLQHHGGPTRLLDWTYSFYAAAYFAAESATTEAAIWAISWLSLDAAVRARLGKKVKPATLPRLLERNTGLAETILKSTEYRPLV